MQNQSWKPLEPKDVISISSNQRDLPPNPTFKNSEFLDKLFNKLKVALEAENIKTGNLNLWRDGVSCEFLNLKNGEWEQGRIRINLEFQSNKPQPQPTESQSSEDSLDEFRNQTSS
jgi:hypothetical protein